MRETTGNIFAGEKFDAQVFIGREQLVVRLVGLLEVEVSLLLRSLLVGRQVRRREERLLLLQRLVVAALSRAMPLVAAAAVCGVEARVTRGADRCEPLHQVLHTLLQRRVRLHAAQLAQRHRTRVVRVAQLTGSSDRRGRLCEELIDPRQTGRLQSKCQCWKAETRCGSRTLAAAGGVRSVRCCGSLRSTKCRQMYCIHTAQYIC